MVLTDQLAGSQLLTQTVGAFRALRNDHEAARVAVEAVNQAHIVPAEMHAQEIYERGLSGCIAL